MLRAVSLLPSATEALSHIGGEHLLVGRSHECDFPSSIAHLPVLTAARTDFNTAGAAAVDAQVRAAASARHSLYTLDESLLASLRPDVVLTQDLCHVCSIDLAAVQRLVSHLSPSPRIVSLNPTTLEDVLDDLLTIGEATNLHAPAEVAVSRLRSRFYAAAEFVNPFLDGPTIAFLEWTDPPFIGGHWTPQLIERAGAVHPLNPTDRVPTAGAGAGPIGSTLRSAGKSVRVPTDVLVASRPDRVIVCPCGLSLAQARAEVDRLEHDSPWWRELTHRHGVRTAMVDGNQMFSRPGPRLVDAFEWLVGWINDRPELIPAGFPWLEHAPASPRL
ncbi:MAG: hypothetical protein H7Y88_13125 [Phycisphaerales bacterium]|nr:hypothetical protein [Phycisphaerales bacterium]